MHITRKTLQNNIIYAIVIFTTVHIYRYQSFSTINYKTNLCYCSKMGLDTGV